MPKSTVLFGFGYFTSDYYPLFERHLIIATIGLCALGTAAIVLILRKGAVLWDGRTGQ
jgi:hypothetical protein